MTFLSPTTTIVALSSWMYFLRHLLHLLPA